MRYRESLRELTTLPAALRLSLLFYLAHVLCEGWIGTSEGFLALSIISAAVAVRRRELVVEFHPLYIPLTLFVGISFISAIVSFRPVYSIATVGEWFTFLTFPLALTLHRSIPAARTLVTGAFIILGSFLSSVGIAQFFLLNRSDLEHRITGTLAHVMTYSGILLPISFILLLTIFSERSAWLWPPFIAVMMALLLSFTRSAWAGWLAGAAALIVIGRPRVFIYAASLLLIAIIMSPIPIYARLISSFDLRQSSNLDRLRMAEAGIEIIRDYPLLGVGPGNIKEIYPLYRKPDAPRFRIPHLHSNPIQLFAERGIVAVAAYIIISLAIIYQALQALRGGREAKRYAALGIALVLSLGVAGLFEFNFGDSEVLLTFLDIAALALAGMELSAPSSAAWYCNRNLSRTQPV